jgi:hypothetical protein
MSDLVQKIRERAQNIGWDSYLAAGEDVCFLLAHIDELEAVAETVLATATVETPLTLIRAAQKALGIDANRTHSEPDADSPAPDAHLESEYEMRHEDPFADDYYHDEILEQQEMEDFAQDTDFYNMDHSEML